jgi:hypothetical protein
MPKGKFKELRRFLIDAIPAGAPEAMQKKLQNLYDFANEPSLMQRLELLISQIEDDFGEEVQGFSGSFARSVVDTRNYNTHFTSQLEKRALDGAGMHWASRRIVLMLTYLFLKNIGVDASSFRSALTRHREFEALFARAGSPY